MMTQKILGVEVAGEMIRGVILEKQGRRFRIRDYADLKRPLPDEDLPDIDTLGELARVLKYTGRRAVYVTAIARFCELFMDRKKVMKMNRYRLSEAAKWEIEPYTGISGTHALVGVEKPARPRPAPGEIVYEETEDLLVNISAVERNVYMAVKERFRAAGLKLVRIYPPEAVFYMPLLLEGADTPRAILEIGTDYSNFAIFKGRHPDQINTLNFSRDTILACLEDREPVTDLENSLKFTFTQMPAHEAVVLSGPGASVPRIAAYLNEKAPHGAVPLRIFRAAGVTARADDPADAVFGTAAGAAIRELSGRGFRYIGIHDKAPLAVRIRQNAYVMPLVATGVMGLGLLGHNQYMQYQETVFKEEIQTYTRQLESQKERIKKYEALQAESQKIKTDLQNTRNKIEYIETTADKKLDHLIAFFNAVARVVPPSLVLDTVRQEKTDDTAFALAGYTFDLNAVGRFATALQENDFCRSAVIRSLKAADEGKLTFELVVQTVILSEASL
jgi:Tfp pilus assembly protein PilN